MIRISIGLMALFVSAQLVGCARFNVIHKLRYETVGAKPSINTAVAESKHKRALAFIRKLNLGQAEQLLREALMADINFGPAHNTLGKVYYDQRKFYLAAWEFEYAIKVMPERPEPHNNLGLVYEAVLRLDQAVEHYETAALHSPQKAEYLGNLVRARVRRGDHSADLRPMLEELILLDSRTEWVDWAKKQLVLGGIDEEYIESDLYSEEEASDVEFSPPTTISDEFDDSQKIESLPDPDTSSRRRDE